jgi:3-methyladenine DNA glycosylase/8-oxoguanine DNA glycosylase
VATSSVDDRDAALDRAHLWIGARDDGDLTGLTVPHRPLHDAARRIGPVRLSVLPQVQEALARAVLSALVQRVEAERSATQMTALLGAPATDGLWCWPTADAIARTPAHTLRRCGIGQRAAAAMHRGALDEVPLERARDDRGRLELRLRAIPGVGVWTAAETRRLLGDPDAVPLGDDGLPTLVCHALTGAVGDDCTDEAMLAALAPFAGQRGRVIRLIMLAVSAGLLPRHPRRGPRAALSAHRYW